MLGLLIVAALASGATAYMIGAAFIARPGSFFRTRAGAWVLVGAVVSFLFLPPQLMGLGNSLRPAGSSVGAGALAVLAWPAGLNREVYRFGWIALMIGGLLTGIRIWNVRKPDWRPGSHALDASPASRAEGLLPLATSLDDALDMLQRAKLTPKDAERLRVPLQTVGRRFGHQLPEQNSAVYNLIARHVPTSAAAIVTGHILDGAFRTGPASRPGS